MSLLCTPWSPYILKLDLNKIVLLVKVCIFCISINFCRMFASEVKAAAHSVSPLTKEVTLEVCVCQQGHTNTTNQIS